MATDLYVSNLFGGDYAKTISTKNCDKNQINVKYHRNLFSDYYAMHF